MSSNNTSKPISKKILTEIWTEISGQDENPYSINNCICRGYDFYEELLGNFSWNELLYFLLKNEFPQEKVCKCLDILMSSIINPGPRDWSTQAAMTAAVTKTTVGNSLLAGLSVLQGRYNGALNIEQSMRMFYELVKNFKEFNFKKILRQVNDNYQDIPGYGPYYSTKDYRVKLVLEKIIPLLSKSTYTDFALRLEKNLLKEKKIGLTINGLFSACLCDLNFTPYEGHGLFLISAAPGLLAHLIEQMKRDWNEYPFHPTTTYKGHQNKKIAKNQKTY